MARRREKDEARKAEEADGPDSSTEESSDSSEDSLALRQGSDLEASSEDSSDESSSDQASRGSAEEGDDAASGEEESSEDAAEQEVILARQLGIDKYVMSGFFGVGILGAYVLGRAIHGIWADLSNRDWFNRALPAVSAVSDDDKTAYGMVLGGIIALIVTMRTYRRPDVREWTDEVASELIKVKWPTKKDVTNSTVVVIAASAVATLYLALLDRLWAFVTSIVYGTGS